MKLMKFFKKLSAQPASQTALSPPELERLLSEQIADGNLFGALATLKKLRRLFSKQERVALIEGCLLKKQFAEAFYLTRALFPENRREEFFQIIVREAAFADDFSTARAAALLLERSRF